MGETGPLGDKLRNKIFELLIAAAYRTGKVDQTDAKTREIMEALTEIVFETTIFIIDVARSGDDVEGVVVVDFIVGTFSEQLGIFGNKAIDCVLAMSNFAVDAVVLAPVIDAAIDTGAAATASGLGAPVGLSVITAALVAAAYLAMQGISANNRCQDAIAVAYAHSSKGAAGRTQMRIDSRILSANSVGLFNFLAKRDRATVLQCSL